MMTRSMRWRAPTRWLAVAATVSVVSGIAPHVAAAQQEPYPGLNDYIAKAMAMWKIPGLSVAIVRNDSVLYTKGFGVLAAGGHTAVNDQTLFEIGSSSKAFTATLVAMLVGDGKMHWDDHVADYLPGFKMYDPIANSEVTIRDALTHRSGIARGELVWLGSGVSRAEVLHRVRFLKPESPFRSQYSYQNMMFLAAGEAAAKAAGTTWEDLVQQRIFTPLGMTSTVPTSRGMTNTNVSTPHGMFHDSAIVKPPFDAMNIAPAGAILSNARDMAQWLRFQLNDGVVNGKRLVNPVAFRETHSPQILTVTGVGRGGGAGGNAADRDSEPATTFSAYGMGWFVEDYRHQIRWQHGGNTPGMTTAVGMIPRKHMGVVVLSSMQSAALPALLMNYIFDRELGLPIKDLSGEAYARMLAQRKRADSIEVAQAGEHSDAAKPSLALTAFAGTYADSLYGEANVVLKDGHLELDRGDWHGVLQFVNASNFRWMLPPAAPTGPMAIKFEIAPDNTVTGLYFGLAGDVALLSRKGGGREGRGRRGGRQ